MSGAIDRIMFVYNPMSGSVADHVEDDILLHCRHHKWNYLFYYVTGIDDKQNLSKLIESFLPQVVVAVGGDGTVNLVASQIINSITTLGIVPTGSTNGLAKELGIPLEISEALDVIAANNTKKIDTLTINGMCSVHICDVGFNARILKRVSKSNLRGKLSYAWHGLIEFMNYTPERYKVSTKDRLFEGEAVMIIITNARGFGYNLHVNPEGIMDDGLFEISIIRTFPRSYLFKLLYRVYRKTLNQSGYNIVMRARKALVINSAHSDVHIDGEPVPSFDKLNIDLLEKSLDVIVP